MKKLFTVVDQHELGYNVTLKSLTAKTAFTFPQRINQLCFTQLFTSLVESDLVHFSNGENIRVGISQNSDQSFSVSIITNSWSVLTSILGSMSIPFTVNDLTRLVKQ
jgi:hypothetical protein